MPTAPSLFDDNLFSFEDIDTLGGGTCTEAGSVDGVPRIVGYMLYVVVHFLDGCWRILSCSDIFCEILGVEDEGDIILWHGIYREVEHAFIIGHLVGKREVVEISMVCVKRLCDGLAIV